MMAGWRLAALRGEVARVLRAAGYRNLDTQTLREMAELFAEHPRFAGDPRAGVARRDIADELARRHTAQN